MIFFYTDVVVVVDDIVVVAGVVVVVVFVSYWLFLDTPGAPWENIRRLQ